jgi:hypothetical protein
MNLSCSAAPKGGYPIKLLLLLRFPRKKSLFANMSKNFRYEKCVPHISQPRGS